MEMNQQRKVKLKKSSLSQLTIYCCGDNYWEVIRLEKKTIPFENEQATINHSIYKWPYYLYDGISKEIAAKIKDQIEVTKDKSKNNIVVCKLDNDIESNTQVILSELCSMIDNTQPMIILIINNVNIQSKIEESINAKEYQHIHIVRTPNNSYIDLYECIYKICSYYNELGDYYEFPFKLPIEKRVYKRKNNKHLYSLNIVLIGNKSCGKSTFLNQVLGEKRAFEKTEAKSTSRITMYQHDEFPLTFYDTPGLQTEEQRNAMYKNIVSFQKKMKLASNESILFILYFINGNTIGYKQEEINFIIKCSQLPVFFWPIVTHCDRLKKCLEKEEDLSEDFRTIMKIENPKVFAVNNTFPICGYNKLFAEMHTVFQTTLNDSNIIKEILTKRKATFIINAAIEVGYFLEKYFNRELANYFLMVSMALKDESLLSKAKMVMTICSYYLINVTLEKAYKLMNYFNWANIIKEFALEINIHKNNELALNVDWIYKTIIAIDNSGTIDEIIFKSLYSRALTFFKQFIFENKPTYLQLIVLNVISLCIVACKTNTYCNQTIFNSTTINELIQDDINKTMSSLHVLAKKFIEMD